MKKLSLIIYTFILMFFISGTVYADHIYKVDMNIILNEDGSADFTEIWDVKADSGSEWYKQLYNMGNEEISSFKVSMDNKPLTYKSWNIDESLSEKRGYYGINSVSEGLELCFGKGDYQRHEFTLSYHLTNVIFNTSDNQVFYQTLIPNATLDDYHVVVRSSTPFEDTLPVWGFGARGYAYVKDGIVEMSNEEGYSVNGNYIVLLIQFPLDTFNTTNVYEEYPTFDSVQKAANKGTYKYNYKKTKKSFSQIIDMILSFLGSIFVPFIILFAAVKGVDKGFGNKRIKFPKDAKKLGEIPYIRELPVNKDVFKGYWIACHYNLIKNKNDFLGTMLLKWLKNGNIENITVTSKILKKEERAIKLVSMNGLNTEEVRLYAMMEKAAKDDVLESNEFKSWARTNYKELLDWFKDVIDAATNKFTEGGFITQEGSKYLVNDNMKPEAVKVAGLKKFLNEFGNMHEKESIEVMLWEEYLMFAQIFGIAKKVAKEFKKLYPDVINEDTYTNVIFIHDLSYTAVHAATSARQAAENYSSGGGGFSIGGGGGGSFGGGGSMGGR